MGLFRKKKENIKQTDKTEKEKINNNTTCEKEEITEENNINDKKLYTINRAKILEKEAILIPPLMWFYIIGDNFNLYNISLATINKNTGSEEWKKESTVFADIDGSFVYIINKDRSIDDVRYSSQKDDLFSEKLMYNSSKRKIYFHPFSDGCWNEDIYTDDDFKCIYKSVVKEIFDNVDYMDSKLITDEKIKEMITDIHREYMDKKSEKSDKASSKFKFYKNLRYLENNTFAINSGTILDGKLLKMLPEIKWIFIQDENLPCLFKIDLAILYKKNYVDLGELFSKTYTSISQPEIYEESPTGNFLRYTYPDIISTKEHVEYNFKFHENVLPDDIYDLNDLKKILQYAVDEIVNAIYGNDYNDSMNLVDEEVRETALEFDEVKTLIKKAHRRYMNETRSN